MNCICGHDIGAVTPHTFGLCGRCGRSKWMQAARLIEPNRAALIEKYSSLEHGLDTGGDVCDHNNNPCLSLCGVRHVDGRWEPITEAERQAWYDDSLQARYKYRLDINGMGAHLAQDFFVSEANVRRAIRRIARGDTYEVFDIETNTIVPELMSL